MKNENLKSDKDFILKNWDLICEETQRMLRTIGINPS